MPPTPNTAALSPCCTRARLKTAPTPVTTPQPMSAADSSGTRRSIGTTWIAFTTVRSANTEAAAKFHAGAPSSVNGWLMLPRLLRHHVGWPVLQGPHMPQLASVVTTTWSPGFTWATSVPTSSTTPAPSCPSTAGAGQGMVPSITLMSLWQTPAAAMRTSTSVGPGARTSSAVVTSAFSPVKTMPFMRRWARRSRRGGRP